MVNAVLRRSYDKGDRRYKHVNTAASPRFVTKHGNPKHVIGQCPNGMSAALLDHLVNEAFPTSSDSSCTAFPKRVYVVHDGAIYQAMTSDQGKTYHGYPYQGKLSSSMLTALRKMAINKGCLGGFDQWVDRYIERHGRHG